MRPSQRIFIFLMMVALAVGYFLGNQLMLSDLVLMVPFIGMALVVLLAAYSTVIHIFLHELGHLIFGKLTGYKLIYFQVPFFRYDANRKKGSKNKKTGPGLLVQCLMAPPEKGDYDEKPFQLYLLGGLLVNLLTAIVLYTGAFLLPREWGFYSFVMSLPPFLLFLGNSIPFGYTDGKVWRETRKSKVARKLYFKQLEMAAFVEAGTLMEDIPATQFEEAVTGEAKQSFLGEYTVLMQYQRFLYEQQFAEADQLIRDYQSTWDYMKSPYSRQVACELLFCHALFGRQEEAKQLKNHIEKYSGLKVQFEGNKRVQAAYVFFVEKNLEKTKQLITEMESNETLVLSELEQATESRLVEWLKGYLVF